MTKICLKIVADKVYHHMITPNSNIYQSQYERSIQCHTHFILKPRKQNNSVRSMKEWLNPLTGRSIQNGAICICFFVK